MHNIFRFAQILKSPCIALIIVNFALPINVCAHCTQYVYYTGTMFTFLDFFMVSLFVFFFLIYIDERFRLHHHRVCPWFGQGRARP